MKVYRILFLGLALFLTAQVSWAQTSRKEQRKIERAEKKKQKEAEEKKAAAFMLDLLKEKAFVLEASTFTGRYGRVYQVSPSTNFVRVAGDQLTVQTANAFATGYNGLGGVTIQGTIRDYELVEDKNGFSVNIQFSDPVLGFSTLNINVYNNGNARAMVMGNWGGRATFQGDVVDLDEAQVYTGRALL